MWLFVVLLAIAVSLWLFSAPVLRKAGSVLENDGPPVKADAIVMLGGDDEGRRILKSAELARQGYAPVVIVGNGKLHFAHTESQLAIELAVLRGYPASLFVEANWDVNNTVEEARASIAQLRSRGAHKAIIVTSLWHTARAGRIYRRLAPDLTFYLVGSDDPEWHNGEWWKDRQGRKVFLLEFTKTVADFLKI